MRKTLVATLVALGLGMFAASHHAVAAPSFDGEAAAARGHIDEAEVNARVDARLHSVLRELSSATPTTVTQR